MTLSDDTRAAWKKQGMGGLARETALLAVLPDGRTIAQALDENTALRALVARFYTQAWEDPLTDDEMALLDPIVNEAARQ